VIFAFETRQTIPEVPLPEKVSYHPDRAGDEEIADDGFAFWARGFGLLPGE
jgi:hypothetical protein